MFISCFSLVLIGWILNRAGFKASPIVLGLVLGQIAEQGFVQAYIIGNAQENILANYFARPISFILVLLIIVSLFMPAIKKIYKRRKGLVND
jgi:putative tricarboxylic transport membrane protein